MNAEERKNFPDPAQLRDALALSLEWLTKVALVQDEDQINFPRRSAYLRWRGAIRGEYSAAERKWSMFCPVWHTGQAVKALVRASLALKRPELLDTAAFCADFILANRVASGTDAGLILAFEDHPDQVNISAVLESLDGLFTLSEVSGEKKYAAAAVEALRWVQKKAWVESKGVFNDIYDPQKQKFNFESRCHQGRPLLDDGVFVTGWRCTGDESLLKTAQKTAETLLRNEYPAGNWISYIPCSAARGYIHPRHAYWWGMPMRKLYHAAGDPRYLACFERGAEWYDKALRRDGGFIRRTGIDFNTECFDHATSGSACAACYFMQYQQETGNCRFEMQVAKSLNYCMKMQFTCPQDPNLRGAILEKLRLPDGTDSSPYLLRDLGTIFFILAASEYLLRENELEE